MAGPTHTLSIKPRIAYPHPIDTAIAGGISCRVIDELKSKGDTGSFAVVPFS